MQEGGVGAVALDPAGVAFVQGREGAHGAGRVEVRELEPTAVGRGDPVRQRLPRTHVRELLGPGDQRRQEVSRRDGEVRLHPPHRDPPDVGVEVGVEDPLGQRLGPLAVDPVEEVAHRRAEVQGAQHHPRPAAAVEGHGDRGATAVVGGDGVPRRGLPPRVEPLVHLRTDVRAAVPRGDRSMGGLEPAGDRGGQGPGELRELGVTGRADQADPDRHVTVHLHRAAR